MFVNITNRVLFLFFLLASAYCFSSAAQTAVVGGDIVCKPRLFTDNKDRAIRQDIIIKVDNQNDFDQLPTTIKEALDDGHKGIEIRFRSGTYRFKHRHLDFDNCNYPDASIRFIGSNCRLIPDGRLLTPELSKDIFFDYRFSYMKSNGEDLNVWTPFCQTDSLIQVVKNNEKICRIHIPESYINIPPVSKNSYVQYTEWYYTRICKIDSISNGFVYFKVPELFSVKDNYNVNYDFTWHKRLPRFRFFAPQECVIREKIVQEGEAGTVCRIRDSKFKRVSFEGFSVFGNQAQIYLFNLRNSVFDDCFLIYDCYFSGQRGGVAYISNSTNSFVQNCRFVNQYYTVIDSDRLSVHTEVYKNYFENCGLGMTNSICARCSGKDYLISENQFVNFGYCAIAVGVWYQHDHPIPSVGIIEHNIIYNTEDYVSNIDQRGLIDGGAIYLYTINDNAIIRYNFINNISGCGSNRGIYCDDGAKNFKIFGNIIMKVHNSNSIDARYDAVLESFDKSQLANINKVMENNIVDGSIKFQGRRDGRNGCFKGSNFMFNSSQDRVPKYDVLNVEFHQEDVQIEVKKIRNRSIVLSRSSRRQLKKYPIYKDIKQYINIF